MIPTATAIVLLASAQAAWPPAEQEREPSTEVEMRPNILLVMSDDQGWADVGFRGHPRLRTPHLDAMAKAGLVLDRYYAAAPVCSPTRGSVLTGKHPMRLGIPGANSGHLPHPERTLAEIASDAGYRTGFFGKWHLGTLSTDQLDSNRGGRAQHRQHFTTPAEHGFHEWFATEAKVPTYDPMLTPESGEPYGTAYWEGDPRPVTDNLEGDDSRVIVDRVEPFLRDAVSKQRPFLAVVWLHSPHLPIVAGNAHLERYSDVENLEERTYYACLTAMDEQVGRMRSLLRELEIEQNTLIWFTSDNGPEGQAHNAPGTAGPLRGRKRDLWEGGVRVPGIVEWPSRIAPGSHSQVPSVSSDQLPTLAPLIGGVAPPALDGIDLGGLLLGEAFERSAPIAFWAGGKRALIAGDWKVIAPNAKSSWQLFDLAADPGETHDLASARPELCDELVEQYEQWRSTIEP